MAMKTPPGRVPAPWLLTPGPLTTSRAVKEAMLRDWGSRDPAFVALNARVRARITALANGGDSFACIPLQGSGTFAIEAALGTLVRRDGKALVLVNGAYGRRMVRICETLGRACAVYETPEDTPPDPAEVDRRLADDPSVTHVAVVHCETSSGMLNPLADVAAATARRGRALLVDAMSTFGAVPLDVRALACEAMVASANKCLEGAPGLAFAVVRSAALEAAAGNAQSLALDLYDQWRVMEGNGQWRFTPPTHVIAALDRALDEHAAEGGIEGRGARYRENRRVLVDGMQGLGFETYLPDALQAPIIVTFHMPDDPRFDFARFYDLLETRGYVIYPGKLTQAETFRIGCIGHVGRAQMEAVVAAVAEALEEMGVKNRGRSAA